MILKTERLILRKPKKSDWKDVFEACKELEVTKNLSVVPHPYKKSDAEWFISHCIKKWNKKEKTTYSFFIELKSEKKVIGVLDLTKINKFNGIAETGSWINKKYWKKGYITEAKIAVNELAFNKLKLRKLETQVFAKNKASNITQEKIGYKYEGLRLKNSKCKATGKIYDINLYGLMKSDWKKKLPKLKKHLKTKIENLKEGKN